MKKSTPEMVITLFQKNKKFTGFQVSGHSDYAPGKEDILCSAVSCLSINTVNSIEKLTDAKIDCTAVNEEEGYLCMKLSETDEKADLLLQSYALGVRDLEQSYGKYLQVKFEEEK